MPKRYYEYFKKQTKKKNNKQNKINLPAWNSCLLLLSQFSYFFKRPGG